MLPLLATLALSVCAYQFPKGATYYTNFKIPLIGYQHVKLIVQSSSVATVSLDGLVRCDGDVVYVMDDQGIVEFEVNGDLIRLMNRYGCTVTNGHYDAAKDTANITIRLRMLALVRSLQLQRMLPSVASHSITTKVQKRLVERIVHPIVTKFQRFRGAFLGGGNDRFDC